MLQISIQRTQTVFRTITTLEIPTNGLRKKENITKGRVQREHAHRERAKSENTKQSDYGDFQTKDATFSQGQAEEFTDKKYRRLLISRKRVAEVAESKGQDAEKAAV